MLEISSLTYAYPDGTKALSGIDLTIDSGERVAILGPNGAGKTTLMLQLNGILRAAAGQVRIDGMTVDKRLLSQVRRKVGLVFQDPDDQLFMPTVAEDVAFGPRNFGLDAVDERVHAALDAVGMRDAMDAVPGHLSFGQRRRVAIATVLACDPSILVLDEPTSNLDPVARRELAEVLSGLGVTLLLVTHDLPFALQMCPRSVILDQGVIVADGPTPQLLRDTALMRAHRLELPHGFHLDHEPSDP